MSTHNYDDDWNKLMDVVEKIEIALKTEVNIESEFLLDGLRHHVWFVSYGSNGTIIEEKHWYKTKKEAVYNGVVYLIKKLNNEPNVQASVATGDDSSNAAEDIKNKIANQIRFFQYSGETFEKTVERLYNIYHSQLKSLTEQHEDSVDFWKRLNEQHQQEIERLRGVLWSDFDMAGFAGYFGGRSQSKPGITFSEALAEYKEQRH